MKHVWTGDFVREHDPDFVDGNPVSVFDNNNIDVMSGTQQSRILLLSADSGERRVYYAGSKAARSIPISWESTSGCRTATC